MMRLQTLLQEPEDQVEEKSTTTVTKEEPKKADLPPVKKAPTKFRDPASMFNSGSKKSVKTAE